MRMMKKPVLSKKQKRTPHRHKVKVYIWLEIPERTELKRVAENTGLSVSETGRAMIVDGTRQRLRLEREVMGMEMLEAFFDKKVNSIMNRLAEYLSRSIYETGQLRWLYVNTLYHDTLRRIAAEKDTKRKEALQKDFYKLLDTSQRETVKAVREWNPKITAIVAAIKERLKAEK